MLEDRDYMRRPPGRNGATTKILVVTLIVAFVLNLLLLPQLAADEYFALSLDGLQRGFVWQLLTFQFLHAGWAHLLLNCWAIYMFGPPVEMALGRSRFLMLYLGSGVAGGLLQMLGAWIFPGQFGGAVVGASAGAFGLIAAFAALYPENRLMMLLFLLVPIRMRAKSLLWVSLLLSGLGIAFPGSILGGNVAHAAHLGGILTGYITVQWLLRGDPRAELRITT